MAVSQLTQRVLLVAALTCLGGCGKTPEAGAVPEPSEPEPAAGAFAAEGGEGSAVEAGGTEGREGSSEASGPEPAPHFVGGPPEELTADFHRTRTALGRGFWVLAEVHNGGERPVGSLEVTVSLLDVDGAELGRVDGEVPGFVGAGESLPVALLVAQPVVHEELGVRATGRAFTDDAEGRGRLAELQRPAAALTLEHDDALRAELGGWFVTGRVSNAGAEPVEGARVEVQARDAEGQMLGLDWLELAAVGGGETFEFDVGGLRYDEQPRSFVVVLR